MMESARRPEYLMGSAEYDTEFYSGHVDVKWQTETRPDAIVVDVDTSDEFFIDDIVAFDDNQDGRHGGGIVEKIPSPVHRSHHSTTRPLYIASKPIVAAHSGMVGSHPPVLPNRHSPVVARVASLDERVFEPHHPRPHFSRLREALTSSSSSPSSSSQHHQSGYGRLSDPVPPRLPMQPVQCSRCGGELNSKCLVQACTKPDQTTCKVCGQEMTIKCILAVCNQDLEAQNQ